MIDLGVIVGVLSPIVMFITIFTFVKKHNKNQFEDGVKAGKREQNEENMKNSLDAAHGKIRNIEHDCDDRLVRDTAFKTELITNMKTLKESVGVISKKMDTVQTDISQLKENVGIV